MPHQAQELERVPYTTSENARKTGEWRFNKPILDDDACIVCDQCVEFCPDAAIKTAEREDTVVVDYDFCKGCGICEQVCPVDAFQMEVE